MFRVITFCSISIRYICRNNQQSIFAAIIDLIGLLKRIKSVSKLLTTKLIIEALASIKWILQIDATMITILTMILCQVHNVTFFIPLLITNIILIILRLDLFNTPK